VHGVVAEGRSFLTRSRGEYDLLQISLIDSLAATASGAFALSENYLYTVEAMRLYWQRLAPSGMLSVSRWAHGERKTEIVRLTLLARRALEQEGVEHPGRHLALATAGGVATLLLVGRPYDAAGAERFDEICRSRGFERGWPLRQDEPRSSLPAKILSAESVDLETGWVDVSPTTDDRPFFFQTVPVFGTIVGARLAHMSSNENSVLLLRSLMLWITVLALALFAIPLAFARRRGGVGDMVQGGTYFGLIGLAFMFVEGPWLQRFILYLGHPSYAAGVVLASLLFAAGSGSLVASRVGSARLRWALLALPVVVAVSNLGMAPVFDATVGAPFGLRVLASIALLAPAGFLMGMALPAGMMRFSQANRAGFWAMNGIASVVGTVLALALAMSWGLQAVAFAGAGVYLLASLTMLGGRSPFRG
jgi:hypothetical protein